MMRSRFRTALLLLLASVAVAGSALADDDQTPADLQLPAGLRKCRASAYVADQDINGVAVRKGPGTAAPIITMLPALRMKEKGGGLELYGADVEILGTDRKGWFLIANAEYEPGDDADGPPRKVATYRDTGKVYRGRGWVHGSRLKTDIVASRGLRAGPQRSAAILHRLDRPADAAEIEASFLDCDDQAVRLRATYLGKTIEGWLNPAIEGEKLCASQRTTCN